MNTSRMIATIQIFIKARTDKDIVVNPRVPMQDLGKLMHMYQIADKWLTNNSSNYN